MVAKPPAIALRHRAGHASLSVRASRAAIGASRGRACRRATKAGHERRARHRDGTGRRKERARVWTLAEGAQLTMMQSWLAGRAERGLSLVGGVSSLPGGRGGSGAAMKAGADAGDVGGDQRVRRVAGDGELGLSVRRCKARRDVCAARV